MARTARDTPVPSQSGAGLVLNLPRRQQLGLDRAPDRARRGSQWIGGFLSPRAAQLLVDLRGFGVSARRSCSDRCLGADRRRASSSSRRSASLPASARTRDIGDRWADLCDRVEGPRSWVGGQRRVELRGLGVVCTRRPPPAIWIDSSVRCGRVRQPTRCCVRSGRQPVDLDINGRDSAATRQPFVNHVRRRRSIAVGRTGP